MPSKLAVATLALAAIACGSSATSSTSESSSTTLAPWNFSPAVGSTLHVGDQLIFGYQYTTCCAPWFAAATELVRDDGAELLVGCGGGGSGASAPGGGHGQNDWMLSKGDLIYTFGVGHSINAAIGGATFSSNPFPGCPLGASFGPINWNVATARADVPLNWRISP